MPRAQFLFVSLFFALVLFAVSGTWLYFAWADGNRSQEWSSVKASVTANDAEFGKGRYNHNVARQWRTSIEYTFSGKKYDAMIDDYLVGSEVTVFVNPNNPSEVVGKQGPKMENVFYPIVATVGTGLFAVVVILIAFSPRED